MLVAVRQDKWNLSKSRSENTEKIYIKKKHRVPINKLYQTLPQTFNSLENCMNTERYYYETVNYQNSGNLGIQASSIYIMVTGT